VDPVEALEFRSAGDVSAVSRLPPAVCDELKAVAARHLRNERPDHTVHPTDLVHETYLRLVDRRHVTWQGRTHFFALASGEMRRVLVDSARRREAAKRWGGVHRDTLDEGVTEDRAVSYDVLAVHQLLERFDCLSPRQARALELHCSGGLRARESACALGVSERTIKNDPRVGRARLRRELSRSAAKDS
jgi:RNA polymerase sigma factor (TIGR02999 family)